MQRFEGGRRVNPSEEKPDIDTIVICNITFPYLVHKDIIKDLDTMLVVCGLNVFSCRCIIFGIFLTELIMLIGLKIRKYGSQQNNARKEEREGGRKEIKISHNFNM